MRRMTDDEVVEFLTAGTRTGKLATTRADGRPHVAPIWFVIIDGNIVFNTNEDTVKAANLRRDPRAALSVDDDEPPYSFVTVEGTATLASDDPELVEVATAIGGRYMGQDRAREFGERNGVSGELVVRLSMDKVMSAADMAD